MKNLQYVLLSSIMYISIGAMAQSPTTVDQQRKTRADSLVKVEQDSENLSQLESNKNTTEAKAKEAQRVERDASDAAHESKIAYRKEKQAQKARNKADKQARKAAKARNKSNNN